MRKTEGQTFPEIPGTEQEVVVKTHLKELKSSGLGGQEVSDQCEDSSKHSNFIKGEVFLDQLGNYLLLSNEYAPQSQFSKVSQLICSDEQSDVLSPNKYECVRGLSQNGLYANVSLNIYFEQVGTCRNIIVGMYVLQPNIFGIFIY